MELITDRVIDYVGRKTYLLTTHFHNGMFRVIGYANQVDPLIDKILALLQAENTRRIDRPNSFGVSYQDKLALSDGFVVRVRRHPVRRGRSSNLLNIQKKTNLFLTELEIIIRALYLRDDIDFETIKIHGTHWQWYQISLLDKID